MATSKYQFENKGIGSLLREGRLTVPPNQRSYAWEERHVENLLQDLNEAITSDNDEYFLGTLVLIEPPKAVPSIADGSTATCHGNDIDRADSRQAFPTEARGWSASD
jgi:uncharacterized protein with ParB-like and HNH nuclease domain